MKIHAVVALATLLATPALALDANPAYRGSGQHAGGPAYSLNSETGGPVARRVRKTGKTAASGQRAGGPAYDQNRGGTGQASLQGTVKDPNRVVPPGQSASGQRAGGSYRH